MPHNGGGGKERICRDLDHRCNGKQPATPAVPHPTSSSSVSNVNPVGVSLRQLHKDIGATPALVSVVRAFDGPERGLANKA